MLQLQDHNCVRELRTLVQQQNQKMVEMQTEIAEHKLQITEQKRELQLLKVCSYIKVPLIKPPLTPTQVVLIASWCLKRDQKIGTKRLI